MLFQKGHKINLGRTPWNKGKKGVSVGGRKKLGRMVICFGCGRYFYRELSKIVEYNFHTDKCFREYQKTHKIYLWSEKVYKKNSGENNHNFKGIMAKYSSLHKWVNYCKGRPKFCIDCGATGNGEFLEWSTQSGLYLYDLSDYVGRCQPCHKLHDKRLGYPRKKCFDKDGNRIGITIFVPSEYLNRHSVLINVHI